MTTKHYEKEAGEFPGAYTIDGWRGIAWYILGHETELDEDTEWSGYETRTGNLIAVMVGDDRLFSVDPSTVHPIPEGSFCPECGQIGCGCYR